MRLPKQWQSPGTSNRSTGVKTVVKCQLFLLALLSVAAIPPVIAQGQDLFLGELRAVPTQHSIGLEWDLTGDTDHDAVCTVSFRPGESGIWQEGFPLYRVDSNGYNMMAGSILFLPPGQDYEIVLMATDPDGGSYSETLRVATRPLPALSDGGPVYHVIPGDAATGGSGTEEDPFLGIAAADNFAEPGTVFLLHAGEYPMTGNATYNGFTRFDEAGEPGRHVVWKAAGDGEVSFPGGAWIEADYVWLDGLEFPGPGSRNGLLTYQNIFGGVITRCSFSGWYQAINLEYANDFYIADNTIVGINDPDVSDFSGEGIEGFRTSGHVIAHNRISRVGDGISVGGSNIDLFGNDIFDTSDDGVELDGCHNNVRMWRNRITNPHNHGISFQPMDGAPWYIVRNQVAGPRALKLMDNPTMGRTLIAHNTFVGRSPYLVTFAHELEFVQSNNNLWIHTAPGDIWEAYSGVGIHWRTDLDFDGFYYTPDTDYPFYWGGVNYPSFDAFVAGTGLEQNGRTIHLDTCFATFDFPSSGPIPMQVMTLAPGSDALDAGKRLATFNDDFGGMAPDLGAYELGAELPVFGPRPDQIWEQLGPGRPGQPVLD